VINIEIGSATRKGRPTVTTRITAEYAPIAMKPAWPKLRMPV
jgi:hypothetical protein